MSYSKANIELLFPRIVDESALWEFITPQREEMIRMNQEVERFVRREESLAYFKSLEDFTPIKVNKVKVERTAGWWAFSKYSISKYSM